jgi:acyl dehydratase
MPAQMLDGETYTGCMRELSIARLLAFSGGALASTRWPAKNLHTDPDKAAEAGLPAPIASGVQCEGDIIRLMTELFGNAWFEHGKLHVKYPRPVFAGMSVRACARVRAREVRREGSLIELDVWCETPDMAVVVVGSASCIKYEVEDSR